MRQPLHVVVGIESAAASRRAAAWTIRLLTGRPAHVTLVTIVPSTVFEVPVTEVLDDLATLQAERERMLAALPDATVDIAIREGGIPATLAHAAVDADLLVIGSPRARRWRSVLSGNLPQRTVELAHCAIVVVPDDWRPRPGVVAVGLDDDASSELALVRAAELAGLTGTEVRVLHTWTRPAPAHAARPTEATRRHAAQSSHRTHLAVAAATLRERFPGVRVVEHLYEGSVLAGLRAMGRDAELVVVGSHRRGLVTAFLLGSVGRDLLRHGGAPVCIVPPDRAVLAPAAGPSALQRESPRGLTASHEARGGSRAGGGQDADE